MSVPTWTLLPFAGLVAGVAVLPELVPDLWRKHRFQGLVTAACAAPAVVFCLTQGYSPELLHSAGQYAGFVLTLAALFVAAGGVHLDGDFDGTPGENLRFVLAGSLLASVVGTTGASMLLLGPFLRANARRAHRWHLAPFFIVTVANAGGLLTPIGDPPLLVGFLEGVPFFWTLRLIPAWLLYVGSAALALYYVDRRAYARETDAVRRAPRSEGKPFEIRGFGSLVLLALVPVATFLPAGLREVALLALTLGAYFGGSAGIRSENAFSLAPILEVALVFAGLFACLVPVELGLAERAHALGLAHAWQFFWVSGGLSSVLDNAPTYAALTAVARGVSAADAARVAGVDPLLLAAVSTGSVVMGATTYIGNGPNLMVKTIAERAGHVMPSFFRYALFALAVMLPAHVIATAAFVLLER